MKKNFLNFESKIPNPPSAVILDWDNTLVDSWGAIAEAINYVRTKFGLPFWTQMEILANCTRSARDSFPEWFGDRWEDAWEEYYSHFGKVRKKLGLTPLPAAEEFLKLLIEKKIPAIVVSNKSNRYLREESAELGWNKYFASIAGAHDAEKDKPEREHPDFALALAGLKASPDMWFIGDSETDVKCARNVGCTPILIGDAEKAQKLNVDIFAPGFEEILEWLNRGT